MGLEAHQSGDNVEDQNISFSDKGIQQRSSKAASEDSMALVSQEKGGKRKRGRPAGSGIKKVKQPAVKQARRARPQIAKKPAKICEYESSDESDSHGKRPIEQEIDTRAGSLDFYKKRSEPQETEKRENVQVAEIEKNSEQNKLDKQKDLNDNERERMLVPEIEMSDRHNEQNNEVTEKLEISADPLQAMLFDMIPSLATQKVKQPMNRSVREEKLPETSNAEAEPMTTKKKKVSYKDVASELLKDW